MSNTYKAFYIATLATLVFYFPSLLNKSVNAGFLYMGDNIGYYIPTLIKIHKLVNELNFVALDFSSFNGSSDFFFAGNLYSISPLLIFYFLIDQFPSNEVEKYGHILTLALALNTFIASFFTIRLFNTFFGFNFYSSIIISIFFSFSHYMVNSLGEPVYLFSICTIPWSVYGAIYYYNNPTWNNITFSALPVILGLLGGYLPLGLTGFAVALVLSVFYLFIFKIKNNNLSLKNIFILFLRISLPFIVALLLVAPYLLSCYDFLKASPSSERPDLFFSAHQLADSPETLLRIVSPFLSVPGPFFELSPYLGIVSILIMGLFFSTYQLKAPLTQQNILLLSFSLFIYFIIFLGIYGEYSVVSDLIYYFIPQIGKMHIYQRFLLVGNIFFGIALAIMLNYILHNRIEKTLKIYLTLITLIIFTPLLINQYNKTIDINSYILIELLLGLILLIFLIFANLKTIYLLVGILLFIPPLDRMYNYTHGNNKLDYQKQSHLAPLDKEYMNNLISYLRNNSDPEKKIIKYVDITPRWTSDGVEYFPKSFSYYTEGMINTSSYTGFNFYLSSRADYMKNMPVETGRVVLLRPNWDIIKLTSADFLIVLKSDLQESYLKEIWPHLDITREYSLANNVVIVPIRPINPSITLYDNGYFKIEEANPDYSYAKIESARQSSTLGNYSADLAIDTNTDGNFNSQTVTHTLQGTENWLELDIGKNQNIDKLLIFNRSDCCLNRLNNFWIFISEKPFSEKDTVDTIINNKLPSWYKNYRINAGYEVNINTHGAYGRYIRIQLDKQVTPDNAYLSIAEIKVLKLNNSSIKYPLTSDFKFYSNNANFSKLEFQSAIDVNVSYLLSNNPRNTVFINKREVDKIKTEHNLTKFILPKGKYTIEIKYDHYLFKFFWLIYFSYFLLLLISLFDLLKKVYKNEFKKRAFPKY